MKKTIILFLLIIFSLSFSASAVSDFARSRIFYDDQYMLLITHPNENSRVTTSSRMSFLGDSDKRHRVYINGEQVATTENGFFTYYAELELGENQFLIVNGIHSELITITREEPAQWLPPETVYFTDEIFGTVEADFVPRFAYFDDDMNAKTPLMSGTTFRILGERGDYYIIGDGTMLFKNHVKRLAQPISELIISGGEITASGNNINISFDVSDNPLYEIILDEETAVLILYADTDLSELNTAPPHITQISKSVQASPSAVEYNIEFARVPVGYMVGFADGRMNIAFRFAPADLSQAFVLLDAGHGGADPGALGPPGEFGSMEKDFNLYVAEVARDYLLNAGIDTLLIRDTNEFVPIMERVEYFALEPDISVSVHANSAPLSADFSSFSGPLMYFTLDISEDTASNMIELINSEVDGFTPHAALPWHRRQNFAMARYTGGPSMLFEMGFMCNPTEYELMLHYAYLDRLGTALGMSIEQYIKGLITAENPEAAETFAPLPPLPPPPVVYDIEDTHPVLLHIYTPEDVDSAVNKYIILIASVIFAGVLLCLPSILRRR